MFGFYVTPHDWSLFGLEYMQCHVQLPASGKKCFFLKNVHEK